MSDSNEEKEKFVTFTFKRNKKQIYIDVDLNATLGEALCKLTDKYEWLKRINNMGASFNEKLFKINDLYKTLKQLHIDENSDIYILEYQTVDLFKYAENHFKLPEQQINNQNFNQFNNFPINQFQFNQPQFNQNQPFNQFQNNMNMNNMQNNGQNQPFNSSTRLKEIYTLLTNSGFCQDPQDHLKLINFLNALYKTDYNGKLYCTYIPVSGNGHAWQQFKRLTSNDRSFFEAAYRILKLFPAEQTPERVIKNIGAYLSNVTNGQFMKYVEQNHNKQPVVSNNFNNKVNNSPFIPLNNNNMMNKNNMNNMQNNVQNRPFNGSTMLKEIYTFLRNNGFCQNSQDHLKLINFLNKLYSTGIYDNIPTDIQDPTAWKNFRSVKNSNNRDYMEAVYRIIYLFSNISQKTQLSALQCAGITWQQLGNYAKTRKQFFNNQNINQNNNHNNNHPVITQNNNMNQNNNMMMNNQNMQNNFNLMYGFWSGDWFALDNRSIDALIQLAGINCDKMTLFYSICKEIDKIDQNLQQNHNPQTLAQLQRNYCLAMEFLRRYYSQEIAQSYSYHEYPLFFNMYDYSQRFVPSYFDLQTKKWVRGRITFYNPVTKKFDTISKSEYKDLSPHPKWTRNHGSTCYLDAVRNSIMHNRYIKAILNRIGKSLSEKKHLGIENYPTATNYTEMKTEMNKLDDFELLAVFAYASECAYNNPNNPNYNQLCEDIIDMYFTKLEIANSLFKRNFAGDVKDYYNYIVEQLRVRLSLKIDSQLPSIFQNQSSAYTTYNAFKDDIMKNNNNVLLELTGTISGCYGCNNKKYNFQVGSFLISPLNKVKQYSIQNQMFSPNGILCTLDNCLLHDQKKEIFAGENMMYCDVCRRSCNAINGNLPQINSCRLPHLIFNSGINNCFNERIYLDQYYKTPDGDYLQLVSFELHMPGHFMSFHKVWDGAKYQWYMFDDTNGKEEMVSEELINQLLHYQYNEGRLGKNRYSGNFTVYTADYQPVARQNAKDITYFRNLLGQPQENVPILFGLGQIRCKKLINPLYNVFYNQRNNNFGEPNPNNPYTAVLGLQQLLKNLGLGNLVNQQANKNVLNQYMTWNNNTQCAGYNNNLNQVQPMNNMFMFPQQFMPLNNKNVNIKNIKQWNNGPFNFVKS